MLDKRQIDFNFQRLKDITSSGVSYSNLYLNMFNSMEKNRTIQRRYLLGLRYAPAASRNHHAFAGGLVQHMLEMWDFWRVIVPTLPLSVELTDDYVLRAIIHHDIEKAWFCYELIDEVPWKVVYHRSRETALLRGDARSMMVLNCHQIPMDVLLCNALFNSHGGYVKDPTPEVSILAKLVYLLDELSGNVLDRARTGLPNCTSSELRYRLQMGDVGAKPEEVPST